MQSQAPTLSNGTTPLGALTVFSFSALISAGQRAACRCCNAVDIGDWIETLFLAILRDLVELQDLAGQRSASNMNLCCTQCDLRPTGGRAESYTMHLGWFVAMSPAF